MVVVSFQGMTAFLLIPYSTETVTYVSEQVLPISPVYTWSSCEGWGVGGGKAMNG
jgi:hypothetical protein